RLLRVSAAGLRDLFYGLFGLVVVARFANDVRLRHDTDERSAFIDDGNAAHLFGRHRLHYFVEILVRRAGRELAPAHHIAHSRIGVALFRDDSNRKIAIGDDADQSSGALIIDDRNDADVLFLHDARGVTSRTLRCDAAGIAGHDVLDLHSIPLREARV